MSQRLTLIPTSEKPAIDAFEAMPHITDTFEDSGNTYQRFQLDFDDTHAEPDQVKKNTDNIIKPELTPHITQIVKYGQIGDVQMIKQLVPKYDLMKYDLRLLFDRLHIPGFCLALDDDGRVYFVKDLKYWKEQEDKAQNEYDDQFITRGEVAECLRSIMRKLHAHRTEINQNIQDLDRSHSHALAKVTSKLNELSGAPSNRNQTFFNTSVGGRTFKPYKPKVEVQSSSQTIRKLPPALSSQIVDEGAEDSVEALEGEEGEYEEETQ
jgi:hypothetical protein